ncbi:acylphosphatase [Hydrogenophaga sp.]|uniref:acylphosphatase n=1 Tax=Hydrogenophaga sp. TaxID=1904254 RepID=UPI00262E9027|nr:acylphosphatase [Hydrogenophaga sp.]MDM7951060.1 acylphosphatase [Hydrogenophaga sp.]
MSDQPSAGAITRCLRITGRVQGVGYRWSMAQVAQSLGVQGWVRNRPDGSVQALVHGLDAPVQALIAWTQHGPALAKVDGVAVTELVGEAVPDGFEQRDT